MASYANLTHIKKTGALGFVCPLDSADGLIIGRRALPPPTQPPQPLCLCEQR